MKIDCFIQSKEQPRADHNMETEMQDFLDRIICGDALTIMRTMPDESIDLVLTSPPYNLKNSTGNGMKDGRGGKWSSARESPRIPPCKELKTEASERGSVARVLLW